MIIKEAYANFGKLNNNKISFNDRFNIICLPNEGGKSTWCAFILTMLYGFDSKDRDRAASKDKPLGYISIKNRYAPWNGTPISGKLIIDYNNQEIEIRRWCGKNGALNNFSAKYTADGRAVPFLTAENCGEVLCGVSRDAYERSGFIKSGNVVTAGVCSNLDEKINSIISSGNEEISSDKISENLKKTRNKIRSNSSNGTLPKALAELNRLNEKISLMQSKSAEQFELHSELLKIQASLNSVNSKISALENRNNIEKIKKAESAKQNYNSAVQAVKAAQAKIVFNNKILTQNFLLSATEQINATIAADAARRIAKEKLSIQAPKESAATPESSEKEQPAQPQNVPEPESSIPQKRRKKSALVFLPPILVSILSIISVFSRPWQISVMLSLIAVAAAVIAYNQSKPAKTATTDTKSISAQAKNQEADKNIQDVPEKSETSAINEEAQREFESAQDDFKRAAYSLTQMFAVYGIRLKNLEQARRFVKDGFDNLAEYERAKGRYSAAKSALDALSSIQSELTVPAAVGNMQMPSESKAQLSEMQKSLQNRQAGLNNRIAKTDGELSAIGDYGKMLAEKMQLEDKIEQLKLKYEAANLALNVLSETNNEFKAQISPKLAEISSKLFSVLTGQKYTNVTIQDGLQALCAENEASALKSALNLSDGAADQLYLALRLALCELVLRNGNNNAPIIMDDALINFDKTRADAALRLLYKLSVNRQIIFFSCQTFSSQ